MNKSDIVGRVADRMGLSKSTAEGAADTVLGAISEALAREAQIQTARASLFAAPAIARDMIAAGRDHEIEEIRQFILTIAPARPPTYPGAQTHDPDADA